MEKPKFSSPLGSGPRPPIPPDQLRAYCQALVGPTVRAVLSEMRSAPPPPTMADPALLEDCLQPGVCPVFLGKIMCENLTKAVRFEMRRQRTWENVMRVLANYAPALLAICQQETARHALTLRRKWEFTGHGTVVRCATTRGDGRFALTRLGLTQMLESIGATYTKPVLGNPLLVWSGMVYAVDENQVITRECAGAALALLEAQYRVGFDLVELGPEDPARLLFLKGLVDVHIQSGDLNFCILSSVEGGDLGGSHREVLTAIVEFLRRWQPAERICLDVDLLLMGLYTECQVDWKSVGVDETPSVVDDNTVEVGPADDTVDDVSGEPQSVGESEHEEPFAGGLMDVNPVADSVESLEKETVRELEPEVCENPLAYRPSETTFRASEPFDPFVGPSLAALEKVKHIMTTLPPTLPDLVPDVVAGEEKGRSDVSSAVTLEDLPPEVASDVDASVTDFLDFAASYRPPLRDGTRVLRIPANAPGPFAPVSFSDVARGYALPGHVACLDASGLSAAEAAVCRTALHVNDITPLVQIVGEAATNSPGRWLYAPLSCPVPRDTLAAAVKEVVRGVLAWYSVPGGNFRERAMWHGRAPKDRVSWFSEQLMLGRDSASRPLGVVRFKQQERSMCAPVTLCDGDCAECPWGWETPPRRSTEVLRVGDDKGWGVPDRWGLTTGWMRVPLRVHHHGFNNGLAPLATIRRGNAARWACGWAVLSAASVLEGYDGLSTYAEVITSDVKVPRVLLLYVNAEDANGGSDLRRYFKRDTCRDISARVFGCDEN